MLAYPSPDPRRCRNGHRGPWLHRPHMTAWLRALMAEAHLDLAVAEQGHCLACGSDAALPLGAVIVLEMPAAVAA